MKNALIRIVSAVSLPLFSAGAVYAAEGTSSAAADRVRPATQSETHPHVGIFAGASDHNGDAYSTSPSFMVDAGFQPVVPFGFALQAQFDPGRVQTPGQDLDFNTTNVMLKETYNFGGPYPVLRNAYIGTKTGVTLYSGDVATRVRAALGVTTGVDLPVGSDGLTLGGEATYLGVLGADDTTPDQASALAAVKYWF